MTPVTKLVAGIISMFILVYAVIIVIALGPVSEDSISQTILVPRGTSIDEIAVLLDEAELIKSQTVFKLYSFISGFAHRLKPGHYVFASDLSTPTIVKKLVEGPKDILVTIIEGRALADIDNQFVEFEFIEPGELIHFSLESIREDYNFLENKDSLEGFLFPDTYRFAPSSTQEDIVRKILDNFQKKTNSLFLTSTQKEIYETLIIASLIEREIPFEEDRELVSGIIHRRLALGMGLQIDATVLYILCEGRTLDCPLLTKEDYKIESIFNTYFINGLPPTPIANPGLSAIKAAQNPEKSDYLFYVSDPVTKRTIFARDLEGHNTNRAKYLQ
jgi:UPF0755 protein